MNKSMKLSKAQLKELLLKAAAELRTDGLRSQYFMCNAITNAATKMDVDTNIVHSAAQDVGFTIENYYTFIKNRYPDLEKFKSDVPFCLSWMSMSEASSEGQLDLVITSKKEFLTYLANRL